MLAGSIGHLRLNGLAILKCSPRSRRNSRGDDIERCHQIGNVALILFDNKLLSLSIVIICLYIHQCIITTVFLITEIKVIVYNSLYVNCV